MARKTQAEMVEALRQQLAEAEAKAAAKAEERKLVVITEIAKIEDQLATAKDTFDKKVTEATAKYDATVVKLNDKKAELKAELDGTTETTPAVEEPTFTELELEEV